MNYTEYFIQSINLFKSTSAISYLNIYIVIETIKKRLESFKKERNQVLERTLHIT